MPDCGHPLMHTTVIYMQSLDAHYCNTHALVTMMAMMTMMIAIRMIKMALMAMMRTMIAIKMINDVSDRVVE